MMEADSSGREAEMHLPGYYKFQSTPER